MGVVTGGGGGTPSKGSAPFTITETNGTSKGLVINTQGAGGVNALEIDAPHTTVTIDGDGEFIYTSDDFPELRVQGGATSAVLNLYSVLAGDHTMRLGTNTGLLVGPGFSVSKDGTTIITTLPTSDPGVIGQLYNVAGVVHVSL